MPTRSRPLVVAIGLVALVAACGTGASSAGTPSSSAPLASPTATVPVASSTPSPTATATPGPTPTATPEPTLVEDDLLQADLAQTDATAVCDPDPNLAYSDAPEALLGCDDGLTIALRAFRTVTQAPIERLYLHYPGCATPPCSVAELGPAEVTGWTASEILRVRLDARPDTYGTTVYPPSVVAAGAWPPAGDTQPPPVKRTVFKGAPSEIAQREPYPFCGRMVYGTPETVEGCFRDAVLAGRPAEMIERPVTVEGDPLLWLDRYAGHGPLIRYARSSGQWTRIEGSMILSIEPLWWDFTPWDGTGRSL